MIGAWIVFVLLVGCIVVSTDTVIEEIEYRRKHKKRRTNSEGEKQPPSMVEEDLDR